MKCEGLLEYAQHLYRTIEPIYQEPQIRTVVIHTYYYVVHLSVERICSSFNLNRPTARTHEWVIVEWTRIDPDIASHIAHMKEERERASYDLGFPFFRRNARDALDDAEEACNLIRKAL